MILGVFLSIWDWHAVCTSRLIVWLFYAWNDIDWNDSDSVKYFVSKFLLVSRKAFKWCILVVLFFFFLQNFIQENERTRRIDNVFSFLLCQKAVKWVSGVSGELAAETIKHVDLSGAWKREQDKLWRSQQKTQYHAQPLQNPDGVKWLWDIVQEVSLDHTTKIFEFSLTEILFLTWKKELFHSSWSRNPVCSARWGWMAAVLLQT